MSNIINEKATTEAEINPIQRLHFELMRHASFNKFDGGRVVDDLIRYKDLWRGVVMGRFPQSGLLIPLRDIDHALWNVDELMILASGTDDDKLELLAKTWNADDVRWLGEDEMRTIGGQGKILRVMKIHVYPLTLKWPDRI